MSNKQLLPLHECRLNRIKASAGAGKTHALTQHFLELLSSALEEPQHPAGSLAHMDETHTWKEILAVTFTNKAAAEMRERIIRTLKERALNTRDELSGTPLPKPFGPNAQKWVELILRHYSSLNIRTIDSLLTLIVRLSSLELGLPPDFKLIFEPKEYFTPAYDLLMQEAAMGDAALADEIEKCCRDVLYQNPSQFNPVNTLQKQLFSICEYILKSEDHQADEINQPLHSNKDNSKVLLSIISNIVAKLKFEAAQLAAFIEGENLQAQKSLLALLDKISKMDALSGEAWGVKIVNSSTLSECCLKSSSQPSAEASDAYIEFRNTFVKAEEIVPKLRNAWKNASLFHLSSQIHGQIQKNYRQNGQLPKTALNSKANSLLDEEWGSAELFCRFGAALKHILIDEFQDTDKEQWQALLPLALEALAMGGSLTVVGDAKQAIYGWRGGDLSIFENLLNNRELVQASEHMQSLNLPFNWRSSETIVNHNNLVFSRLEEESNCVRLLTECMPKETPGEVVYAAAKQLSLSYRDARQKLPPLKSGLKGLVSITRIEDSKEELEERIKNHLHALLTGDVLTRRPYRDVVLLVRSNDQAFQLSDWLASWQIPVITENSLLLSHNPIIRQAVAFLRWLNMPLDDLAFFEFICGEEIFARHSGLSAEKLENWIARLNIEKYEKKPQGILFQAFRTKWPELWKELIAPFYNQAGLMSAYDLICELFDRFDVAACFPDDLVFILRFQEILHLAEKEGMAGLPSFLEWWDEYGKEEKLPMPETFNAVRVMTIHKAKGLEFPVVVLPFELKKPGRTQDSSLLSYDFDGHPLLLTLKKELGEPYYQKLASQFIETVNLFYVAWTRASEELYILSPAEARAGSSSAKKQPMELLLEMFELTSDGAEHRVGETPSPSGALSEDAPPCSPAASPLKDDKKSGPPMNWLPRLKIFRNNLDSPLFDATSRGTFIHQCIQGLTLTGDARSDVKRAFWFGLKHTISPQSEVLQHESEILSALLWLAELPQAENWLANGMMEQIITDETGENLRCDLIVYGPDAITVVEFKSGAPEVLPDPAHIRQVEKYIALLRRAQQLPVKGVLAYLDQRRVVEL